MTRRQADDREQILTLRARLAEADEMLRAIRQGEVDALVVEGVRGSQVYTLHNAEEPYRALVEEMQEGAVVLSGRGDILYSNARFAALVGSPLETVSGSPFDRFVHAADKRDVETLLGVGAGRLRCRLLGSKGRPFEVGLSATTTKSGQGDRRNLIVTDMTELLEAHSNCDRAERDSRTKDEFLAMLAHELRNPLGAISTAAHVLKGAHGGGESATRAHAVIERQIGQVTRLIDDLLDIERVVSGKIRLNRQPLDLADLLRRAVEALPGDARLNRGIDFSTAPAWVDGDAVRIEQVITNLLTNAIKYTPPGGRIQVALRADGADAVISVEDSGFGIAPSLLPSIFDLYVQADRTIAHARGGLGVGLALVRRLVELHGGTVTASSDGEGHGSRFTVRLTTIAPVPTTTSTVTFLSRHRAKPAPAARDLRRGRSRPRDRMAELRASTRRNH